MEMTSCRTNVAVDATASMEDAYVCCKFHEKSMEILVILGDDTSAFRGEVLYKNLERYANSLNVQLDEYVSECKNIFSGQRTDTQFLLRKSEFIWKKKVILGKILITKEENYKDLMQSFTLCLVNSYSVINQKFKNLEESSKALSINNEKLRMQLECLTKIKNDMELDIYKKTIKFKTEISSHWLRSDNNSIREIQVLSQESELEMELKLEEDDSAIPSPTSQNESEEIIF
ncbi:uncharacterized protein LOC106659464 [Trichogramma pretiosum]|uniref:uncharacterized protein LOC106659464 n=1 Tax=Trichogramma pretiosum TaxID=7493 RepID=UPI0006C96C49|nr:uncharacterized protein LOC106659464 [Trichogramma pretiosum]